MKCALLMIALFASALGAQDWVPTHIVAIAEYPRLARIAHLTGDVEVLCFLNKDGSVAEAAATGPGILKDQARQNALLWKFHRTSPKKRTDGNSVTLTYRYRLEGGPAETSQASFSVDLPNVVHVVAQTMVAMID